MTHEHPTTLKVWRFIDDYQTQHGVVPTLREIAAGIGVRAHSSISPHLNRLVYRKAISAPEEASPRSYKLLKHAPAAEKALSLDDQALIRQEQHCLIIWHQDQGNYVGFEVWHPDQGFIATVGEVK